jgi:DNA-binding CsgD family transcriptional regulator
MPLVQADPFAGLSARKRQVAEMVAAGASRKVVAQTLNITVNTVRTHLNDTYRSLEVFDRSSLAALQPAERKFTREDWDILTKRERQVFAMIGAVLTPTQIAYELGLSVSAIGTHQSNIRRKLGGMEDRVALVHAAVPWHRELITLQETAGTVQPLVCELVHEQGIRDRSYLGMLFLMEETGESTLRPQTAWIAQNIIDNELRVSGQVSSGGAE